MDFINIFSYEIVTVKALNITLILNNSDYNTTTQLILKIRYLI